jgi:hypothetical protein
MFQVFEVLHQSPPFLHRDMFSLSEKKNILFKNIEMKFTNREPNENANRKINRRSLVPIRTR